MTKTRDYKTISFRADPETVQLLEKIKTEIEGKFGFSVSASDVMRKALEKYEADLSFTEKEEK